MMTREETREETGVAVTYCERHPDVETGLTCGRCATPICPRCLVHTPGGIRCPDCARLRRPVMYELAPLDYAKAGITALVAAVPLGVIGALIFPPRTGGFFLFVFALLGGLGAGAVLAEAISRATGRKRGRAMQLIAVGAVLLAGALRFVLSGLEPELLVRDLGGALLVVIAAVSAWNRLA